MPVAFLCTNYDVTYKKLFREIYIIYQIKNLGINLITKMKNIYNKNYKTMMEANEEHIHKCKEFLHSWSEKNNIIMMPILTKTI